MAAEGGHISIVGDSPAQQYYAGRHGSQRLYAQAARHRHRYRDPDQEQPDDMLGYAPQPHDSLRNWWENPTGE